MVCVCVLCAWQWGRLKQLCFTIVNTMIVCIFDGLLVRAIFVLVITMSNAMF